MIWWSLTIAPFHTYHPTPPRVPSRDRSRERRGGERSRRIDPDLWVFAGVIGVIILNQPKKLGVKNSWLPYFWGVYCRASRWNYQLPPPQTPQKKTLWKMDSMIFQLSLPSLQNRGPEKMGPIFSGRIAQVTSANQNGVMNSGKTLLQTRMWTWVAKRCQHRKNLNPNPRHSFVWYIYLHLVVF